MKNKDETKDEIDRSDVGVEATPREDVFMKPETGKSEPDTEEIKAISVSLSGECSAGEEDQGSDEDQITPVKEMKRVRALRMPYWLKKTKKRSLKEREDPVVSSSRYTKDLSTRVRQLFHVPFSPAGGNTKSADSSADQRKSADSLAVSEKSTDSAASKRILAKLFVGKKLSADSAGKKISQSVVYDPSGRVTRSQSLSEAYLRPRAASLSSGSSASGSLGRRVATLGRLRGRQVAQSLKDWAPHVLPASQPDFENIRYKVGQSSFYLLSDGGEPTSGGRTLLTQQTTVRYFIQFGPQQFNQKGLLFV